MSDRELSDPAGSFESAAESGETGVRLGKPRDFFEKRVEVIARDRQLMDAAKKIDGLIAGFPPALRSR